MAKSHADLAKLLRAEDARDAALRDAAYWEAMAENADREWDDCRTKLDSVLALMDLARDNYTAVEAERKEAQAEVTRLAEVLNERWAELARLEQAPDKRTWQFIARETGDDLVRCQEDCDALRAQLARVEAARDAALTAAAEWERIAGEWELDYLRTLDALDEANSDLRAVRKQLADREVEVLTDQRDAALVAAADEPPGGWAAYAAGWQTSYRSVMRGYMDTLAERDHANRQLALVEAEAEVLADQRDAAQRERMQARAALTAVLDLLEDADLLARARAVAAGTPAEAYITYTDADLAAIEADCEARNGSVGTPESGAQEPPNGAVVVDASHVAWQRRDVDAFDAPANRWFQVGQEDGDPWTVVTAAGPVTVVWTPAADE
jgi:hypothetical protein